MSHARPDWAILFAVLGVLVAIGIPSIRRGQWVIGGLCLGLAVIGAAWALVVFIQSRR